MNMHNNTAVQSPLDTALQLAAQFGFHVFPLKFDGKAKKGHMKQQFSESGEPWGASNQEDHIRKAWQLFPSGQLGIACGIASGVWVVEGDISKEFNGVQWLRDEFIAREGQTPDTIMQRSPSGSVHYLFAWPDDLDGDIRNSQSAIAPGVDVRGNGGMIAAVPSVRPDGRYEWIQPPGLFELQPAPEWLVQMAVAANKGTGKKPTGDDDIQFDTGQNFTGKTPEEYAQLIANLSIDGKKHAAVRDIAASMAGQGCAKRFTEGFIRHHCPVWDNNCRNSLDSAFLKYRKEQREKIIEAAQVPPNAASVVLVKKITKAIREALPDLKDDPFVDVLIVRDMIEGAFWSGAKKNMFLLNEAECLIQFVQGDAWRFLCRRFGSPIDPDEIISRLETDRGEELKANEAEAARKAIHGATVGPIIDYLKYENQRDSVEWSVDMFGKRSRLELKEDVARIVLTHRPLVAEGKADPVCVADYRSHFPLIDEMLEYIVAGRFALDRKKSYLWMLASSDWGKGFLMGALTDLGLLVQMSVKEIEGVFEGKPAGRKPEDFKRAMILAVDEFKAVKSELKQLQSEIHIAPKHQLTARVEIFTKLFLSAESVGSLVGENGVEDQFANRMSMLTGTGTLNERAIYKADQGKYYRAIRAYVADELNKLISGYTALGKEGAEKRADTYLNAFIGRHGLDQHFERLSASYPMIAEQAVIWFDRMGKLTTDGRARYLTAANKHLDDYFQEHYGMSEISTLRRRKTEIMAIMSSDGRGIATYRVNGAVVKAVKLKV